jgi:hypothetical protein
MARLKGLSVRIIFSLRLMVICTRGPLPIRPKSQNGFDGRDPRSTSFSNQVNLERPNLPKSIWTWPHCFFFGVEEQSTIEWLQEHFCS